jgi:antagonist of KipI
MIESDVLHVRDAGLYTTVQDLGRPQAIASGVPPGGAMDRFAHSAANLIVGNERGAATLECTLKGPHLIAARACLVAVTGADFEVRVNRQEVPMWTGIFLGEGDELTFGKRRSGARAYIALAGGVAGDRWLGSLSTYAIAGRGGVQGRALVAGDVIAGAAEPEEPLVSGRHVPPHMRPQYDEHGLGVIPGPHADRMTDAARAAMYESSFAVTPDSDRMGYRLEGPRLEAEGEELLSFGLVAGAVQLPAGGQPILLMADHQTAGGYPVVAVVMSAAMPVAAQLAPGDEVTFNEVRVDHALKLRADQRAVLASMS